MLRQQSTKVRRLSGEFIFGVQLTVISRGRRFAPPASDHRTSRREISGTAHAREDSERMKTKRCQILLRLPHALCASFTPDKAARGTAAHRFVARPIGGCNEFRPRLGFPF
jgi:hypothetical protein